MYNRNDIYFCIYLTTSEHHIVEWEIKKKCDEIGGVTLKYYRELKDGHVPCYREVKIEGCPSKIGYMQDFLVNEYEKDLVLNPHKTNYKCVPMVIKEDFV